MESSGWRLCTALVGCAMVLAGAWRAAIPRNDYLPLKEKKFLLANEVIHLPTNSFTSQRSHSLANEVIQ
jgi:hypothetical protein